MGAAAVPWKVPVNNGTDLWEANLRNGGAPPPQPTVQKAPWGHTPTTNIGEFCSPSSQVSLLAIYQKSHCLTQAHHSLSFIQVELGVKKMMAMIRAVFGTLLLEVMPLDLLIHHKMQMLATWVEICNGE